MKAAIKLDNKTFITGYNKAIFTEIKTENFVSQGKQCVVTNAYFHVSGAKDTNFEKFSITDSDDNANLDICNMILEAFGKKLITVGEDPTNLLNQCINKECALLMYPQAGKDGKVYHHTARYGNYNGNPAVLGIKSVGQTIDATAPTTTEPKSAPKSDEDIPF